MKHRTDKRQEEEDLYYSKTLPEFLEENPYCELCLKMADTVHHKKGRVGSLLNNKEFLLSVCNKHHRYIHNHPKWSCEMGYMVKRNDS